MRSRPGCHARRTIGVKTRLSLEDTAGGARFDIVLASIREPGSRWDQPVLAHQDCRLKSDLSELGWPQIVLEPSLRRAILALWRCGDLYLLLYVPCCHGNRSLRGWKDDTVQSCNFVTRAMEHKLVVDDSSIKFCFALLGPTELVEKSAISNRSTKRGCAKTLELIPFLATAKPDADLKIVKILLTRPIFESSSISLTSYLLMGLCLLIRIRREPQYDTGTITTQNGQCQSRS